MAGFGGALLGGVAQGYEAGQKLDLSKAELGIKSRLADISQQEVDVKKQGQQQALLKDMVDRSATAMNDATALWEKMVSAAPDKGAPQLLQAGQIIRGQLEQTTAGLAQIPGGLSVGQSALKKFDAITAGLPSALEAATTAGKAEGAKAVAAQPGTTAADIAKTSALAPVQAAAEAQKAGAVTTAQGQATNALAPATAAAQGNALVTKAETMLKRPLTDPEKLQLSGAGVDQFGPLEVQNGVLGQTDKRTGKFNVLLKPETPESITVNPNGTVNFQRGGQGDKTIQTEAAKKLPELTDQLVALRNVQSQFKPEFLTLAGQGAASMTALMERLGADPSPEAKKQLADITAFQQSAISQLNQAIKTMSGTAVNGNEEKRMLMDMPDPKGDSPTQFTTKLDQKIGQIKMAVARYAWAARNGMSDPTSTPLEKMPQIMADRARAIRAGNPNISDSDLAHQLSSYFGLIGQ